LNKKSFLDWQQGETEAARMERQQAARQIIQELCNTAKLTPRQSQVRELWDRENAEIAQELERRFSKAVTPGAVRKLRHDVLEKLKRVGYPLPNPQSYDAPY
jgi:hypothetical protein